METRFLGMSAQRRRAYVVKPERAQRANERIVEQAVLLRFVSRLPLYCECGDRDCDELVLIELDGYRDAVEHGCYLTAVGHAVRGAQPQRKEAGYWVHRPHALSDSALRRPPA
jgi:hypothetical protein